MSDIPKLILNILNKCEWENDRGCFSSECGPDDGYNSIGCNCSCRSCRLRAKGSEITEFRIAKETMKGDYKIAAQLLLSSLCHGCNSHLNNCSICKPNKLITQVFNSSDKEEQKQLFENMVCEAASLLKINV